MTAVPIPRKRGFCHSMRFEERHVSCIGAIERLLAAAAHHHVENELVAVFIGIDAERADLVGLLRLAVAALLPSLRPAFPCKCPFGASDGILANRVPCA